jgi:hypothetical protein
VGWGAQNTIRRDSHSRERDGRGRFHLNKIFSHVTRTGRGLVSVFLFSRKLQLRSDSHLIGSVLKVILCLPDTIVVKGQAILVTGNSGTSHFTSQPI